MHDASTTQMTKRRRDRSEAQLAVAWWGARGSCRGVEASMQQRSIPRFARCRQQMHTCAVHVCFQLRLRRREPQQPCRQERERAPRPSTLLLRPGRARRATPRPAAGHTRSHAEARGDLHGRKRAYTLRRSDNDLTNTRAAAFPSDKWPGTPFIRLETKSGQSDPPMLTRGPGLDPAGH